MLTRLEIDGFKSLRDFAIDLEPFTVLIGPNSAGKSNILEAIALLSRLARMSFVEALQGGRGRILDQFTHHQGRFASELRLGFDVLDQNLDEERSQTRFRAELAFERSEPSTIEISSQHLRGLGREEDTWGRAHHAFASWLLHETPGERLRYPAIVIPGMGRLGVPQTDVKLAQDLQSSLDSLHLSLHAPELREASERLASTKLVSDASNLPTVLAAMPPPLLGQVRAALSTIVPGVASFEVIADKDLLEIEFILSGGERIPARLASDGTLRVLALLAAAFAPHGPKVICIEEPENGIYPRRLRDLLKILHERTQPREGEPLPPQIILTTHSPVAISALRSAPECIRFVDTVRRNGQRVTRVRKIGTGEDHGRTTVSVREIEELLDLGTREDDA